MNRSREAVACVQRPQGGRRAARPQRDQSSPTGLLDTRDQAAAGQIPEADPADAELAIDGAGTAAEFAAVPVPDRKLRRRLRLQHLSLGRHGCPTKPKRGSIELATLAGVLLLPRLAKRETKRPEQLAGLVVALRRRDDRDVHTLGMLEPVSVDLWKDHLLGPPDRGCLSCRAAIEAVRIEAMEITGYAARRSRSGDQGTRTSLGPGVVTLQPISFPSRSRKPETETVALVTWGF